MAIQSLLWAGALLFASTINVAAQAEAPGYESPQVYPSPNITGLGGWQDALAQAQDFIAQLTTDEKFLIVTGTAGPCVGNIAPIPRLGFEGMCLQDGPLAIRQATYASAFPAGIAAASSWDRSLIHERGVEMAREFRGKGSHVILGPVCGPLGRIALAGRNWEGFSPDPYLTGVAMVQTIVGIQSVGVQACAKHYIANEQETQRNPSFPNGTTTYSDPPGADILSLSSNVDDRTMHEVYLWPFADSVKAGVASVMCSYNRINGTYGCQNSKTLNGLLKDELGFQGYVMSDWGGTHSTLPAILAGLDMEMPGDTPPDYFPLANYFNGTIQEVVANGSLPESRIDDMVARIMTPYFYLGQDEGYPSIDPSSRDLNLLYPQTYRYDFNETPPANRDVRDGHAALIRALGAQASVLLKNVNGALPLRAPTNIGVFGSDAADSQNGLYGFQPEEIGALPIGGGSGAARLTYLVSPLEAIKARARQDNALVQYITNNTVSAASIASIYPTPEVCIVFLKTYVSEAEDRTSYDVDDNGNAVVTTVAARCNNTIVVTHSGGINILPWADNENVTAIIAAHLPGQEIGNSIVDVLYGDVNPSGHLVYTIAYNESDYNTAISNYTGTQDPNGWQSNFTEGLLIDYRHFDDADIEPLYEFGFGLSYTTFDMSDLTVTTLSQDVSAHPAPVSGPIPPGGNPALYDVLVTVSAVVANTGDVAGATVPQLYLAPPQSGVPAGTPPQTLHGFDKVYLTAGQNATMSFPLTRRDFSYWDIVSQEWRIPEGEFEIRLGFSSRDQPLSDTMTLL